MDNIIIYAICCPVTGMPVYIGKSRNFEQRIKSHMADTAFKPNHDLWFWIKNLLDNGGPPEFKKIATCINNEEAIFMERFYIKSYGQRYNLFNHINNKRK